MYLKVGIQKLLVEKGGILKKNTVSSDVILYAHWQKKDNANKLTSPKTGYNLNTIYLFMIISFASIGVSGYSLLKKNN